MFNGMVVCFVRCRTVIGQCMGIENISTTQLIILLALVEYEMVIDNPTLLICDQAIFSAENKNA